MMILGIRDLEQTAVTQQVVQELKKDSASRVDLFCTDSVRALDRLQKTFLANGVTLRIDPATRAWLDRRPAARTNLAIYSEELSAEDLGKILQQLAGEDKKAGAQFDKVVVNGVTPAEMAKVLGGDPANYQQPPQKGPLGVDIHKPVEEKTASQLVQALSGQGPSRADLEKERVPNRQAVLIHYPSQAISREVKALVESRKEWRTGAVQVLFILWNNG